MVRLIVLLCIAALLPVAGDLQSSPIKQGEDRYEFTYRTTLPMAIRRGTLWVPLAHSGPFQTIEATAITGPSGRRVVRDRDHGNTVLIWPLSEADAGSKVEIRYKVTRTEKSSYAVKEPDLRRYLRPERLVPLNENFRSIAARVVEGKDGEMARARALYEHVLERMRYDKSGKGWGRGDAVYACDAGTGNCTDFHAYFIALSRSLGMPARFAIGYTIPAESDAGVIGGYHCWAEIAADGKWVPVDISEADKHPELAEYYFGHHPANRLEVSTGRDLVLDPLPKSGVINFLVYPLLEVNGEVVETENEFTFRRL